MDWLHKRKKRIFAESQFASKKEMAPLRKKWPAIHKRPRTFRSLGQFGQSNSDERQPNFTKNNPLYFLPTGGMGRLWSSHGFFLSIQC